MLTRSAFFRIFHFEEMSSTGSASRPPNCIDEASSQATDKQMVDLLKGGYSGFWASVLPTAHNHDLKIAQISRVSNFSEHKF